MCWRICWSSSHPFCCPAVISHKWFSPNRRSFTDYISSTQWDTPSLWDHSWWLSSSWDTSGELMPSVESYPINKSRSHKRALDKGQKLRLEQLQKRSKQWVHYKCLMAWWHNCFLCHFISWKHTAEQRAHYFHDDIMEKRGFITQVMQFSRAVWACSVVYFLSQHQHETCTLCKILLFNFDSASIIVWH